MTIAKVYSGGRDEKGDRLYSLMIDDEEIIRTPYYDKILDVAEEYGFTEDDFAYNNYLKQTSKLNSYSKYHNKYNYYFTQHTKKQQNKVTKPFAILDSNNHEILKILDEKKVKNIYIYHCARYNKDILKLKENFEQKTNDIEERFGDFIFIREKYKSKLYNNIIIVDEQSFFYKMKLSDILFKQYFNDIPNFTYFTDNNPFNIAEENLSKK